MCTFPAISPNKHRKASDIIHHRVSQNETQKSHSKKSHPYRTRLCSFARSIIHTSLSANPSIPSIDHRKPPLDSPPFNHTPPQNFNLPRPLNHSRLLTEPFPIFLSIAHALRSTTIPTMPRDPRLGLWRAQSIRRRILGWRRWGRAHWLLDHQSRLGIGERDGRAFGRWRRVTIIRGGLSTTAETVARTGEILAAGTHETVVAVGRLHERGYRAGR